MTNEQVQEIATLRKESIGRVVLCSAREQNATRLFVRSFVSDESTKQGWWNMFTRSRTPFKKGYHFVTIKEFKFDKNEHINMIVEPLYFIGEYVNLNLYAWKYLQHPVVINGEITNIFSSGFCDIERADISIFFTDRYFDRHDNKMNLIDMFYDDAKSYCISKNVPVDIGTYLFNKFVTGSITIEEIQSVLDMGTKLEREIGAISESIENGDAAFIEKYPNFAAACNKHFEEPSQSFELFLKDLMDAYNSLFKDDLDKSLPTAGRAEKVLIWRKDAKERKKLERKAKRQNRSE